MMEERTQMWVHARITSKHIRQDQVPNDSEELLIKRIPTTEKAKSTSVTPVLMNRRSDIYVSHATVRWHSQHVL